MPRAEIPIATQFTQPLTMEGKQFASMRKWDLPPDQSIVGHELVINGTASTITVACFQESIGKGHVLRHPEPHNEEVAFFLVGSGLMQQWDAEGTPLESLELNGFLTREEAINATYELAIATDRTSQDEHLVLNVTTLDGEQLTVNPATLKQTHQHQTMLHRESLYFVVKHAPTTL